VLIAAAPALHPALTIYAISAALFLSFTALSRLYVARDYPRPFCSQYAFAACGWLLAQAVLIYATLLNRGPARISVGLLPVALALMLWRIGSRKAEVERGSGGNIVGGAQTNDLKHSPAKAFAIGVLCFVLAIAVFVAVLLYVSGDGQFVRPGLDH
jgi:hypothetical protein